MPATPARVAFILEPWRRTRVEDQNVRTRYGNLARESEDPVETFFDDTSHAAIMAQRRMYLLSKERRRFSVQAKGLDEALGLDFIGGVIPAGTFTDREKEFDGPVILAEVGFDFDKQLCQFTVWG